MLFVGMLRSANSGHLNVRGSEEQTRAIPCRVYRMPYAHLTETPPCLRQATDIERPWSMSSLFFFPRDRIRQLRSPLPANDTAVQCQTRQRTTAGKNKSQSSAILYLRLRFTY